MGTPYAGNQDDFPQNITILSGSDLPNTTNFNTTSEGLADRTAYVFKRARSLNWLPSYMPVLTGPILTLSCTAFDTLTLKWIVSGDPGGWPELMGTGYGDEQLGVVLVPDRLRRHWRLVREHRAGV